MLLCGVCRVHENEHLPEVCSMSIFLNAFKIILCESSNNFIEISSLYTDVLSCCADDVVCCHGHFDHEAEAVPNPSAHNSSWPDL